MHTKVLSVIAAAMLAGCAGGSTTNNTPQQETKTCNFLDTKEKAFDGFTLYWILDSDGERLFPYDLFGDIPEDIKKAINQPDGLSTTMSAYLIKTNGKNILFDSGMGQKDSHLIENLSKAEVTPEQIDYVYITHFHGDHIGGMVDSLGNKVFTNAEVYVSHLEKESELGKGEQAQKMFETYGDKIHEFNHGDTLPEDVKAIEAIGHTPGHTVFQKGNLLIIGDLMHALALQYPYPEYNANFDGDKEKSAAARKRILQYAKDNGLTICGMHLVIPKK